MPAKLAGNGRTTVTIRESLDAPCSPSFTARASSRPTTGSGSPP